MKLPNHEHVTVPKERVVDDLLSTTHRDGRHNAVLFNGFGVERTKGAGLLDRMQRRDRTTNVTITTRVECYAIGTWMRSVAPMKFTDDAQRIGGHRKLRKSEPYLEVE